jgi:hypothetical protein
MTLRDYIEALEAIEDDHGSHLWVETPEGKLAIAPRPGFGSGLSAIVVIGED